MACYEAEVIAVGDRGLTVIVNMGGRRRVIAYGSTPYEYMEEFEGSDLKKIKANVYFGDHHVCYEVDVEKKMGGGRG